MYPSIASLKRAVLRAALLAATASPAYAAGQQAGQQDVPALADSVPLAPVATAEAGTPQPRAITRIVLTAEELPVAGRMTPAFNPRPRAPERQLERDAITLRAARAAMLQNDASHQQQRLAALR